MIFASICEHAGSAIDLRARAVIKFVLRAASTSENADGEQRELRKFSASWNLSFIERKRCFASKTGHIKILSRFNRSQQFTDNYYVIMHCFTPRSFT